MCAITFLLCHGADDEEKTLFLGEDFHIDLPPKLNVEVTFKNNSDPRRDVVLMRGGIVVGNLVGNRTNINSYKSHLIINTVGEGDEGVYTIKNPENPKDVKVIKLVIRGTECVLE